MIGIAKTGEIKLIVFDCVAFKGCLDIRACGTIRCQFVTFRALSLPSAFASNS